MMRLRTTLALALSVATVGGLGSVATAGGKGKPKAAPKPPKGDSKPVDLDAPLPGDEPAPAGDAGGDKGGDKGKGGDAGAAVEMGEDTAPDKPSDDPTGTKENPNDPKVGDSEAVPEVRTELPAPRPTGYPLEEALRPITLPQNMSEVALDLRTFVDHADAEAALRARYGITRQAQIGLEYDIGGVFKDVAVGASTKFNTGKAAAIEGSFLVTDWVAIHVRLPIYMQPFAMGVTLGAPMKFRFGDAFAIYGLDNVVDITAHNFTPSLTDELANRAAAANLTNNTVKQDGALRFVGGAIYQLNPKTALIGQLGMVIPNFSDSALYPLEGVLQWSPSPKIDLAGRLGFDSLASAGSTFGFRFTAAFRI